MKSIYVTMYVVVIMSMSPNVIGQQISKISNSVYAYKENIYKYSEMGDIFKLNDQASLEYTQAIKTLELSKKLGYVTLGLVSSSVLLIAVDGTGDMYCDTYCFSSGDIIGFIAIVLFVPVIGTSGIIQSISGGKHKRKSIDIFNRNQDIGDINLQPIELSLGVTNNGLGMVLTF